MDFCKNEAKKYLLMNHLKIASRTERLKIPGRDNALLRPDLWKRSDTVVSRNAEDM
jgi:hypothetical protein